ncbi:MAG: hypothetical protein V5A39_04510 [Haloarculaceae archaeon]
MEQRHGFGVGIGLAGLVLAVIQTLHGIRQSDRELVFAFEAGPFVLVALALAYAGVWLARNEQFDPDLERILAWGMGSTLLFASVAALMLFSQRITLGTLDRASFIAIDLVTVGAVVGVVVGLYDARGQRQLRQLERQRDRIETFANKAADVNNYGRAFNRSGSLDEVSGLCIQAMQALLGISETAVVVLEDAIVYPVDNTIINVEGDDLAPLVRDAREYDSASVVTHDDPQGALADRGDTALSILLADDDGDAVVVVATVPEEATLADEDLQLVELLASHAETALDDIWAGGPVESGTATGRRNF